jgi:hypothetical protein
LPFPTGMNVYKVIGDFPYLLKLFETCSSLVLKAFEESMALRL